MRYQEIFERDTNSIIAKLKALIDHPSTEPPIRANAQAKLNLLTDQLSQERLVPPGRFKPSKFARSTGFKPMFPHLKKGEFKPTKF